MIVNFKNFLLRNNRNIIVISLCLIVYYLTSTELFGYFCISEAFFGLPCPACGLTRATILALKGEFRESFQMNPLLAPVFIYFLLLFISQFKYNYLKKYVNVYLVLLIIVSFVLFGFRVKNEFGVAPLVFNKNSLTHKLIERSIDK